MNIPMRKILFVLSVFLVCLSVPGYGAAQQTRQKVVRTDNLWPFYLHSKSETEEETLYMSIYKYFPFPLLQVYHKERSLLDLRSELHIGGLYHFVGDPYDHTSVLFPFWLHKEDPVSGFTLAGPLAPFYFSSFNREREKKFILAGPLLPVFFSRTSGGNTISAAGPGLPILWYTSNPKEQRRSFVLLPVCCFLSSPERDFDIMLLPPHMRIRNDEGEFNTWFPFYWSFKDRLRETVLVPPYYRVTNSDGTRDMGIVPVFFRSSGPGYYSWKAPLLLSWGAGDEKEKTESCYIAAPFGYMRSRSEKTDFQSLFLPFGYIHSKSPETEFRSLFLPLGHFKYKDKEMEARMYTPFGWYFKNQFSSLAIFGPLYQKRYEDSTTSGIFPFAWFGRGEGYMSAGILPLAWGRLDKKNDTSSLYILPPIGFMYSRDGDSLFESCLIAYRSREDSVTREGIFPLLWASSSPEGKYAIFFPFYFFNRDYKEKTMSRTFIPFFHYSRDDIAHTRLQAYGCFLPAYISYSSPEYRFRLSPVYWDYSSGDGTSTGGILPMVPLWYRWIDGSDSRKWVFPSYFSTSRGANYHSWMFSPFAWGHRDTERNSKSLNIIPFWFNYSRMKSAMKIETTAAPLLLHWYSGTQDHSLSVYGPYYDWKNTDGYRRQGIFPLAWRSRQGPYSTTGVLPFYWSMKDTEKKRYSNASPFHYRTESPERKFSLTVIPYPVRVNVNRNVFNGGAADNQTLNFPLYTRISWFNKEKNIKRTHILAGPVPLIQETLKPGVSRKQSLLWYLYRKETNFVSNRETIDIPWLYSSEKINGEATYVALGPRLLHLYVWDKTNNERFFLFFFKKTVNEQS